MSLYCFGKIKLKADKIESFTFPVEGVFRQEVDADDAEEIESMVKMGTIGIYFSICDHLNSRDATALWNEARSQSPERVAESRLGRAIYPLLFDARISVGAIAFVDGGIETVLTGTPEQCWAWFLERIAKPWDTIDNPIMIWKKPE